jgi:putative ABC transport system substrate-binding protein
MKRRLAPPSLPGIARRKTRVNALMTRQSILLRKEMDARVKPAHDGPVAGTVVLARRGFMSLLGAAAAWPLAVCAQQGERMRRVGVLLGFAESDSEAKVWLAAFEEGLQKLGWSQGRNLRIDYRWAGNDEARLRSYAAELVGAAPDVLFAATGLALVALNRETRSLPIVFVQVADPVKLGFVETLARPGRNITGFTSFEYAIGGKWLELLKDTAPGTTRVAVIFDPRNPTQAQFVQGVEAGTPAFGVQLTLLTVRDAAELERAIDAFAQQPNGGLIVVPNIVTILHRDLIIALAARHRLPAVYPYRMFTTAGGFISYGIDLTEIYRRAASYVDLILKGAKPAELPVQLSAKFEFVVNLKAAKALGLTIPEPFLQRADEVIE